MNKIIQLFGGVTQQPIERRPNGAHILQENLVSDISKGIKTRPPVYHIQNVANDTTGGGGGWSKTGVGGGAKYSFYRYIRGLENYLIFNGEGLFKVFKEDGTEQHVVDNTGSSTYLDGTGSEVVSTSVEDYTLLLNTTQTVAMKSASTDPVSAFVPDRSVVFFMPAGGEYDRTYKIRVKGTDNADTVWTAEGTFTTPDGTNPATDVAQLAGDYILDQLYTSLKTARGAINDTDWKFTSARNGTMMIQDKTITEVSVEDQTQGVFLKYAHKEVKSTNDLPPTCVNAYFLKVNPVNRVNENDSDASYWKFNITDKETYTGDEAVKGTWQEWRESGLQNELNEDTMPHALIYTGVQDLSDGKDIFVLTPLDGQTQTITHPTEGVTTFPLNVQSWGARQVGNEDNNPKPYFVDKTITNLDVYKSRLLLLTNDTMNFSRTGRAFNFFFSSALQTVDSDPIEVRASTSKYSDIRHTVQVNENLIIFTDNYQLIIKGTTPLTPSTISINTLSDTLISNGNPIISGSTIKYGFEYNNELTADDIYSGVYQTDLTDLQEIHQATPLTNHIPDYIRGSIYKITDDYKNNTTFYLTNSFEQNGTAVVNDARIVYTQQYFRDQSGKLVQNAWSKWIFPFDIIDIFTTQTGTYVLYATLRATGHGINLGKLNWKSDRYLDNYTVGSILGGNYTFPNGMRDAENTPDYITIRESNYEYIPFSSYSETGFSYDNNISFGAWFGIPIESKMHISPPIIKDRDGNPFSRASLIIKRLFLKIMAFGVISTSVKNLKTDDVLSTKTYSALSFQESLLNNLIRGDATLRIPFSQRSSNAYLEIECSDWRGMNLTSLEWEGNSNANHRR